MVTESASVEKAIHKFKDTVIAIPELDTDSAQLLIDLADKIREDERRIGREELAKELKEKIVAEKDGLKSELEERYEPEDPDADYIHEQLEALDWVLKVLEEVIF